MNLSSVVAFIEDLDSAIAGSKLDAIVYCSQDGRRSLTNAAFLLGAYMIVKMGEAPDDVADRFKTIGDHRMEGYRDVTYSTPTFRLELIDCWRGLKLGLGLSWLAPPTIAYPQVWGMIDMEEYTQYDNPLNADLHEVVPGKFVAFQGPCDLPGTLQYRDDEIKGTRCFSPSYYIDIFRELGVTTVIRLNESHYNRRVFTAAGIQHHDLYFDDCTSPPPDVVTRFFVIVDAAPGVVAVHCKAGLGRTGTLIALYLMRSLGFTAREAMGWLRIMRPGSVIGEQQEYLCAVERIMQSRQSPAGAGRLSPKKAAFSPPLPCIRGHATKIPVSTGGGPAGTTAASASVLAAQVAAGMARRGAARSRPAA